MTTRDPTNAILDDTLGSLSSALQKKIENLEAREKRLKKDIKAFKDEKALLGSKSDNVDIIHLNVSGTKTSVLRGTLTSVEGSLLASLFSGRWDDSLEKDDDGNFFINYPAKLFFPLIEYLQVKESKTPKRSRPYAPSFGNDKLLNDWFHRMIDHYGLTKEMFPFSIEHYAGPVSAVAISDDAHNVALSQNAIVVVGDDQGHQEVKSFEVSIGNYTTLRVGWINKAQVARERSTLNHGLGDYTQTYGLVFTSGQGHYSFKSSGRDLKNITGTIAANGTTIRCEHHVAERRHNWYVNGDLVITSADYGVYWDQTSTAAVSGIGSFGISNVEFFS